MDTKKTIFVSVLTTLATMFVVMICMHMCKSHCGQTKCGNSTSQCSSSYGNGDGQDKCASYSKCSKGKSCSGKSKCSEGKSCTKSKCSGTTSCKKSGNTKTCTMKSKDGKEVKVIKKTVEAEK